MKLSHKGSSRLRSLLLFVLSGVVLAFAVAVVLDRARVFSQEGPTTAQTDEEWIALIRDAEDGSFAGAYEPPLQPGTKRVYDCSLVPDSAELSQAVNAAAPAGPGGTTYFFFKDPQSGEEYQLVVPWSAPPSKCNIDERSAMVAETAKNAQAAADEINTHICSEMELMSKGEDRTDPSLRDASPAVAQEYVEAFCVR